METLRVYKAGLAEFSEITSATLGGFSDLTINQVRNGPGGLTVGLAATTIAMLHAWVGEASRVELWADGVRQSAYVVDKHSPRWGSLTATLDCVGAMIHAQTPTTTVDYDALTTPLAAAFQALVAKVPQWVWNPANVNLLDAQASGKYDKASVLTVLQDLAESKLVTVWIDDDNEFHAERLDMAPTAALELRTTEFPDGAIVEFEPTFTLAKREMKLEVIHDPTLRVGMKVNVLGVGDGRPYLDVIQQITSTIGEETDELLLGYLPPVIVVQDKPLPTTDQPGKTLTTDANGDPAWTDPAEAAAAATEDYLDDLPDAAGNPGGGRAPDQVLTTDAAGNHVWVSKSSLAGGNSLSLWYAQIVSWNPGGGILGVSHGGFTWGMDCALGCTTAIGVWVWCIWDQAAEKGLAVSERFFATD